MNMEAMKNGKIILASAAVLFGVAIFVGAAILHDGLSSRATPTNLEAIMARSARHLAIPSGARSVSNPLTASPELLLEARRHFADHCALCHGNDGGGKTLMGEGLYPKPPDLRLPQTQDLSDGELFWITENGVRFTGMPAFSGHGPSTDSWKLVLFIRHLSQLSLEERLDMEKYNPKGPDDRAEEKEEEDFMRGGQNGNKSIPQLQPEHKN
jgi:mono/diheme cytochrome c family protein